MTRTLPYLAALALLIASGAVHGLWTGRWTTSHAMEDRVAELKRVPFTVGDWRGQALSLDGRAVETGDIAGHLVRHYVNPRGDSVTLLIVCGRPGPIAVHTPEVCYQGSGYEQLAPATRFQPTSGSTGRPDGFWSVDFRKPGPVQAECLRVIYSWNDGRGWSAVENPRLDFAGTAALDKIYVIRETTEGEAGAGDEPSADFLRQLLPVLRTCLFTKSA